MKSRQASAALNPRTDIRSPNFDDSQAAVEFVVIHYTAAPLKETLEILSDPERKVSAHLVISESGEIFELVECWQGRAQRAWHAGESRWHDGRQQWEKFNEISLGIELVNLNGNVFPYPDGQYEALVAVIRHLQSLYPALKSPERLIGHEQIAGWRGKCDPGWLFDWGRVYSDCFGLSDGPKRNSVLPEDLRVALEKLGRSAGSSPETWSAISSFLESSLSFIFKASTQDMSGAKRPT